VGKSAALPTRLLRPPDAMSNGLRDNRKYGKVDVQNVLTEFVMTTTAIRSEAITIDADDLAARKAKREAFRQDTLKALEEYLATGLHLTAEEVEAWLLQLEQGNDVEPPECHT
jgi:predicted transcriptional regulator